MGASAQLSTTDLAVEPGHPTTTTISVRNDGSVVDRFSFEVVGGASRWVTFNPETLSLFPQAMGDVTVTFTPPRDPTVAAGDTPFGIRVVSSEEPGETVVEEGTIKVGSYSDVSAEIIPHVTSGRRWARAQLAIDNRSNCPYRAELEGKDPSSALLTSVNPTTVEVRPGEAAFVKVRLKPKRTFWRGPSTNKPYAVVLSAQPLPGAEPAAPDAPTVGVPLVGPHRAQIVADGSMLQESLIASWAVKVAAAVVGLAILFTVLWFALFRPQIKTSAENAARSQLAAAGVTPSTGSKGSSNSSTGAPSGSSSGSSNATTGAPASDTGSSGAAGGAAAVGTPINGTGTAHGNGVTSVFVVPKGKQLEITDLLVENSAGSAGTLTLERNGTILMQWALADFRDLDYHWIVPTLVGPGTTLQMVVGGCTNACTPGIYYAGNLVKTS